MSEMSPMLIVLFAFLGLLIAMIIGVCIAYCYTKTKTKQSTSAHSLHTGNTGTAKTEEPSGNAPLSGLPSNTQSAEKIPDMSPFQTSKVNKPGRSGSREKMDSKQRTHSLAAEKSVETGRLRVKHFNYNGVSKRFTRIPEGPLTHLYSNVPRNHTLVPKIHLKEIKGDITMYPGDFSINLPILSASRRKTEILEQYYHLGQPEMDNENYRRKRNSSLAIPEPVPLEGNHEKVKSLVEGIPFLECKPYLAKLPVKRDDTTRHFILNTQYASRLAIRFKCDSGRYVSIPSHEIIEPCGRLRVVIVANSDTEDQPEKEVVYYEYLQVPERAMDAHQEFMKRPVIGRITLRMFPNVLNLSPNTFYPSSRRRTPIYTSTLTNSGKSPCKFAWPEDRDISVSPQNGFIKPQSSVQFTFTLKRPANTCAILVEMKYSINDKPSACGVILARFETAEMKKLIQVATKALAACDTAEDPGNFG